MPLRLVAPGEKNLTRIIQAIRDLGSGRTNAHSTEVLTLAHDGVATTTTVTAPGVGAESHISITARNAAMATEMRTNNVYVSAITQGLHGLPGSFTITHSASAALRNFTCAWHG